MKNRHASFFRTIRMDARLGLTRPPMARVLGISKAIQSGKFPNCRTLAEDIEVTPKTIQRDICYMRDQMNYPVEYDDLKHGYYFTGPVQDLPPLCISRQELVALFLARKAMEPIRGTRMARALAESFAKIAGACTGDISFRWTDFDEAFSIKTAGMLEADLTLFTDLLDAARERREVVFGYQKLTASTPERRQVQPLLIDRIEGGWYLVAHDPQRGAKRTFALQRMTELKVLRKRFERPKDFNPAEYLSRGFGVWSYPEDGPAIHEVRIRLEGYAARIVAERQWHPSQVVQKVRRDGSVIELRLSVPGLEELTRWILSWGGKAMVLAPVELKRRVADQARLILEGSGG